MVAHEIIGSTPVLGLTQGQCDHDSSGRCMLFKKATVVEVPQSLQKFRALKLNVQAEI